LGQNPPFDPWRARHRRLRSLRTRPGAPRTAEPRAVSCRGGSVPGLHSTHRKSVPDGRHRHCKPDPYTRAFGSQGRRFRRRHSRPHRTCRRHRIRFSADAFFGVPSSHSGSPALRAKILTLNCPHCNHSLARAGAWFMGMSRFECTGCRGQILMTYDDKLALFGKHANLASRKD
jgi:hypothetical protein